MGLARLCVLSGTMFLITFAIGNLPLTLSSTLSPRRIRQISVYGVGLLVGAALTIIIPEGVDAVYESKGNSAAKEAGSVGDVKAVGLLEQAGKAVNGSGHGHGHEEKGGLVGLALILGFLIMFLIDQLQSQSHSSFHSPSHSPSRLHPPSDSSPRPLLSRTSSLSLSSTNVAATSKCYDRDPEAAFPTEEDGHDSQPEDYYSSPTSAQHPPPLSTSKRGTSQGEGRVGCGKGGRGWSTTVGLVAHSLADGISLGASSAVVPAVTVSLASETALSTEPTSLDLVIFIAIMVHKAPAAFGLTAVLLSDNLPRRAIRRSLLAFSAAAPVGAFGTWGLLRLLMSGDGGDDGRVEWWTGMALLFSGGTFLFVATHVMQESYGGQPELDMGHSSNSYSSENGMAGRAGDGTEMARWEKTLLMVAGMLSPMVLTKVAGHAHC